MSITDELLEGFAAQSSLCPSLARLFSTFCACYGGAKLQAAQRRMCRQDIEV